MGNENTYNYDNHGLASSGAVEHLVRNGMIEDTDGTHQPRTPANGLPPVTTLEGGSPKQPFVKADAPIYELSSKTGREYLTYGGIWVVEFFKDQEAAKTKLVSELNYEGKVTFTEKQDDTTYKVIYNEASSQAEYAKRGLDLDALRQAYDNAEDISALFDTIPRNIEAAIGSYFLRKPLEEFERDENLHNDVKYFTASVENYANLYFGGRLTGSDIGFYYDNAGRMRASYDPHYLFKADPLLQDLLRYGHPEQYVVGRYPSGMVQFVIEPELAKLLVDTYGSEDALAKRWNDSKIVYSPSFNMGNYPTFEKTLNVESSEYVSSDSIFGFTADENGKKPQAG